MVTNILPRPGKDNNPYVEGFSKADGTEAVVILLQSHLLTDLN